MEDHFRSKGRLLTFEITGGIPETLPRLLDALRPYSALTDERKVSIPAALPGLGALLRNPPPLYLCVCILPD